MSFLKVVEPHLRSSEVIVRCIIENKTRSLPFWAVFVRQFILQHDSREAA